ncbi:MAG: hypothetical protein AAF292_00055 [Pseudomonadota bacterium]
MSTDYEAILDLASGQLRSALSALNDEIRGYPTPISGCDAQFNRLLSDRAKIGHALKALESQPFIPTPRMVKPMSAMESR